jgi:hypothetical protein
MGSFNPIARPFDKLSDFELKQNGFFQGIREASDDQASRFS